MQSEKRDLQIRGKYLMLKCSICSTAIFVVTKIPPEAALISWKNYLGAKMQLSPPLEPPKNVVLSTTLLQY